LRELIQAHKDYWLDVKGIGKEDGQSIPDLEVFIVDLWPTKEKNIPIDHDGVMNRNYDLLLYDKTDYDEKVANIVSDYIKLAKDLIGLAKSRHRSDLRRTYHNLIEGKFDVDIKRIERPAIAEILYQKVAVDYLLGLDYCEYNKTKSFFIQRNHLLLSVLTLLLHC
jgi:hypothetical protein